MNEILTVSQINLHLKQMLDEDVELKSIFIRGEISNFTHHLKSGHFYFTLKDAKSAIKAVMFKWNASHLRFKPANGMSVIIFGSVQLYERDGVCQIYCTDMQPDGVGALYTAFEQLKEKLEREGLFDPSHKQPLPPFPKRIGIITAKTGAALQDVINILSRRYPLGELVLIPALVQGELAPASICDALEQAEKAGLDLLIVGRGGGSIEDLWAFNDEQVARAVYRCLIPTISAVGHETDYTICDFVADLRAPTPSAAAELAVPDCAALWDELWGLRDAMDRAVQQKLLLLGSRTAQLEKRLAACSPVRMLDHTEKRLDELSARLHRAVKAKLKADHLYFCQAAAALDALSPLKVLTRGYSIARKEDGTILKTVSSLQPGDRLTTMFADGEAVSEVLDIRPAPEKG